MRILYIDHHASAPQNGGDTRAYSLAKEWNVLGDETTILTAEYSHRRRNNPELIEDFTEKSVDGVRFCYLCTPSYEHGVGGIRKNVTTFIRKLYTQAPLLAERYHPEVIISACGYPYDFFCAQRIAKLCGAKIIFEFREVWPVLQRELYPTGESRMVMAIADYAMNYALKNANLVISLLPEGNRYCQEQELKAKAYRYLPPSAPLLPEPMPLREEDAEFLLDFRSKYSFVVAYAGKLSARRQPELLVDAVGKLEDDGIGAVIAGSGGYKLILRRLVHDNGYRNILFLDALSERRSVALLGEADCLYYSDTRQLNEKYGDYSPYLLRLMRFGKPMALSVKGTLDAAQQCFCGLNAAEGTADALAGCLRRLAKLQPEKRRKMGENAVEELEAHRSIITEAARYREEMQKLWE